MIPIAKVQAAVSRDKISEPFLAYVGSWHIASVRCDASTAIAIGGIADVSRSLVAPRNDANDPQQTLAAYFCCAAQHRSLHATVSSST